MGAKRLRTILVGEDEAEVRDYFEIALKCLGYGVEMAEDGDELLEYLQLGNDRISGVLLDVIMPRKDGLEALREIRRLDPQLPVIMVSGASSTLHVVEAMKLGATDFLCKPVAPEELGKALAKAFAALDSSSGDAPCDLPGGPEDVSGNGRVYFGKHVRYKELNSLIGVVGWSDAPVLIQGETGSGKEVLARELHANSPRARKPFLKINCAALPSELVESELFGYERGAFTGAFQKKTGMFEMADGGTVLLDEIGDMDFKLQAKLLQVLQDREFHRIGGKEMVRVDVRVMSATHRDLEKAIAERTFREDLYYRLNVINLKLPALRECAEDVLPLAEFLMRKSAGPGAPLLQIPPVLREALLAHKWPGNIRELDNVIRKYLILRDPELIVKDLRAKMCRGLDVVNGGPVLRQLDGPEANSPILEQVTRAKHQAESEAILAALNSTHWNRKQAAHLLKIDYKALLYKMKKLGLEEHMLTLHPDPKGPALAVNG